MLDDRGLLEGDGATVRLTAADTVLPDSIQTLIAARLDTLPPEGRAVLQDAAVVGTVFWSGALFAIDGRDPAATEATLGELARRAFIRAASRSSVAGEGEYAFWHTLTREVAYGQLPRTARIAKHRAVAAWIERVAGDGIADHAELLAHHYLTALELARAARAAEETAALHGPARRFLVLAGDRAMTLDVARADVHYRRALALLGGDHPERATVLEKAAEAAQQAGRTVEAEELLGQAIAASRPEATTWAPGRRWPARPGCSGTGARPPAPAAWSATPSRCWSGNRRGPGWPTPTWRWARRCGRRGGPRRRSTGCSGPWTWPGG